jgi:hypothetical protein
MWRVPGRRKRIAGALQDGTASVKTSEAYFECSSIDQFALKLSLQMLRAKTTSAPTPGGQPSLPVEMTRALQASALAYYQFAFPRPDHRRL